MSFEVRVVEDPAATAADLLRRTAEAGGSIVLAGGSTPRRAYELSADADWEDATLLFGDERCVPPDDERSNYGMVVAALLDRIDPQPAHVHRIAGEDGPEAAAMAYDALVADAGTFDLVLLGIGEDGHTASLFPGKPAVDVEGAGAVGVPEAGLEPFVPRVSLTVGALVRTRQLVFLVSGSGKADAVRRAFGPDPDLSLPSARVAAAADGAVVLLDADAAAELP